MRCCLNNNIRKAFAKMDLDNSGSIDADELGWILKSFGEAVPLSRVNALIREVQTDGIPLLAADRFFKNAFRMKACIERRG